MQKQQGVFFNIFCGNVENFNYNIIKHEVFNL